MTKKETYQLVYEAMKQRAKNKKKGLDTYKDPYVELAKAR